MPYLRRRIMPAHSMFRNFKTIDITDGGTHNFTEGMTIEQAVGLGIIRKYNDVITVRLPTKDDARKFMDILVEVLYKQ